MRGTNGGKREWGYVILGFRVPTASVSHISALPPMYPPNIVYLHPPSLQSSCTYALPLRGQKVVRGIKGGKGNMGYVILCFSIPTTSASWTCALPPRGGRGNEGEQGDEGSGGYVILHFRMPLMTTYSA